MKMSPTTHAHFLCESCVTRFQARRVNAQLMQCPGCVSNMPYFPLSASNIVYKNTTNDVVIEEIEDVQM